jgi:hypothetical protein
MPRHTLLATTADHADKRCTYSIIEVARVVESGAYVAEK